MLAPTGLSFSAGKLVGGADVSNGDRTWVVGPQEHGARLERFLAGPNRLASRGRAREALARGKVFVNAREVSAEDGGRLLAEGDQVRLWMDRPGSARSRPRASSAGEPSILYDDQDLVVLDKPAGLLSVPLARREEAPSAYEFVERHLRSRGKRRPHVVHRIDRDTSGLVVFATNARAQGALKEQFRRRQPERVYLAVVYGCPEPPSGTWRDHLVWDQDDLVQKASHPRDPRAKEATSDYRCSSGCAGLRSSRCGSSPASATRFGSRRGCGGTRSWASSGTSSAQANSGPSRFRARRCTPSASRSATRPTAADSRSSRRSLPISDSCWWTCATSDASRGEARAWSRAPSG
jgi:23S rRNA-/tRNA-specific pseudouridylate synthase